METQISVVNTTNNCWMLKWDMKHLESVYKDIEFDFTRPKIEHPCFWVDFVRAYANVEFDDILGLVNVHASHLYPVAERKVEIMKSENQLSIQ